jgi:hypothetical protein
MDHSSVKQKLLPCWPWGPWLRWGGNGDFQGTTAVKLLKRSAFPAMGELGGRGTGSLATAYGVWEKDGESYVYSRSTFEGGGNKKSGEIKPDG